MQSEGLTVSVSGGDSDAQAKAENMSKKRKYGLCMCVGCLPSIGGLCGTLDVFNSNSPSVGILLQIDCQGASGDRRDLC